MKKLNVLLGTLLVFAFTVPVSAGVFTTGPSVRELGHQLERAASLGELRAAVNAKIAEEGANTQINATDTGKIQTDDLSAETQFIVELFYWQVNASQNRLDDDGIVEGTEALVKLYQKAVKGHSDLYALELYSWLDNKALLAKHSRGRTIGEYFRYALNKKEKRTDKRIEKLSNKTQRAGLRDVSQQYFANLQNELNTRAEQFKKYGDVVREVAQVRDYLRKGAELTAWEAQVSYDIDVTLENDRPGYRPARARLETVFSYTAALVEKLDKASDDTLQLVAVGLLQDPLISKNGQAIDLPKFWGEYRSVLGNTISYSLVEPTGKKAGSVRSLMSANVSSKMLALRGDAPAQEVVANLKLQPIDPAPRARRDVAQNNPTNNRPLATNSDKVGQVPGLNPVYKKPVLIRI